MNSSSEPELQPDNDHYKKVFKLYKHDRKGEESLIDFANLDSCKQYVTQVPSPPCDLQMPICPTSDHFKPYDQWKMYTFRNGMNGLVVIPQILKPNSRPEWFDYFHRQLPLETNLNLKSNISLKKNFYENLRWITFGLHYDWTNKVYPSDQSVIIIPDRVRELSTVASTFLGHMEQNPVNFEPQAGIVNYYTSKSSLFFHTDHSEFNKSAPLFSFSLGSSALFLIGGLTKESSTPILPILLRDSDLLIMSKESRLALHAVAKITCEESKDKNEIRRININIRQVH